MPTPRWMMSETLLPQLQAERAQRVKANNELLQGKAPEAPAVVQVPASGVEMTEAKAIETFMFAGRARFTLVSVATGKRFTYRIGTPKGKQAEGPWFASVLSGPNNEEDYTFMGSIFAGRRFKIRPSAKSPRGVDKTQSFQALEWFLERIVVYGRVPTNTKFYHEGACCRCGRALTVPSSIESGIGPECASKMEGF